MGAAGISRSTGAVRDCGCSSRYGACSVRGVPRSRVKTTVDAIDLLRQDHDRVAKAFKEFERIDRQDAEACRRLVHEACEALKVHTAIEEEIFYPAVREAINDGDLMNEAAVEHETAKMLIDQLDNMAPDDPNYYATFTVLGEYVRHHVKQEQDEIFPAAKRAKVDLAALGERMRARKEELAGELA